MNKKEDIIIVAYLISILIFTPFAALIQLGLSIYLIVKREWDILFTWVWIVIVFTTVGYIMIKHGIDPDHGIWFSMLRLFGKMANIAWFIYAIKKINNSYKN